MTRIYALRRLLEHGELSRNEMLVITGWKPKHLSQTIYYGTSRFIIERLPGGMYGNASL